MDGDREDFRSQHSLNLWNNLSESVKLFELYAYVVEKNLKTEIIYLKHLLVDLFFFFLNHVMLTMYI